MMFIFFMVLALIFLIAGGIGLFYTNVNLGTSSPVWMFGNIAFGTFTFVGAITLIFMALFGHEMD